MVGSIGPVPLLRGTYGLPVEIRGLFRSQTLGGRSLVGLAQLGFARNFRLFCFSCTARLDGCMKLGLSAEAIWQRPPPEEDDKSFRLCRTSGAERGGFCV